MFQSQHLLTVSPHTLGSHGHLQKLDSGIERPTRLSLVVCIQRHSQPSPNMSSQPELLKGKVAAITGGITGIGRAIAIGFLQHGCRVAVNHLGGAGDEEHVASLTAQTPPPSNESSSLVFSAGDVADPETGKQLVARAVQEWGRLDIFVSNAGICQFAEFLEYDTPSSRARGMKAEPTDGRGGGARSEQ